MIDVILETIERALLMQIREHISTELSAIKAEMDADDAALYAALGRPVVLTPLPDPVWYDVGHHPRVLYWSADRYPNIICNAYQHPQDDASTSTLDQGEEIHTSVYAEAAVAYREAVYGPDAETMAQRAAKRYVRAMHRCYLRDLTLSGHADRVMMSPEAMVSNVQPVAESDLNNSVVFYAVARIEFVTTTTQGPYFT